jgi:preprotein translocase subunit YajC
MLLAATQSNAQGFNPMYIILIVILIVFVLFSFRSNRKRRQQMDDLKQKMVPGTRVMTQFGLFGTIVSVDEANNRVDLEVSPGSIVTVHRQVVTTVVKDDPAADAAPAAANEPVAAPETEPAAPADDAETSAPAGDEPKYGKQSQD